MSLKTGGLQMAEIVNLEILLFAFFVSYSFHVKYSQIMEIESLFKRVH